MRGWKGSIDAPLKKPPLDIVEIVSDLVDLTAIADDGPEDPDKREKKARKEQKRKEKEKKKEELRQEARARAKALREERLQREAEEAARKKADEAALRAAARREGYDRIARGPTIEDLSPPEAVPEPAAKRQRHRPPSSPTKADEPAPTTMNATTTTITINNLTSPSPPAVPEALPPAVPPSAPPPSLAPQETASKAFADQLATPPAEGRAKAAPPAARKASMAEAIAAAKKEQGPGISGFASFEGFDAQASHEKAHGVETEEFDEDDDDDDENPEGLLPVELYSLQDLPEELLLGQMSSEPGLYVAHYVRFVLGAWQRSLASGAAIDSSSLTNQTAALFQSKQKFQATAEALKPLLRQLRSRKMGDEMLSGLETVVKLAAEREYNHANSVYVGMTMGRKTWHNSLPCFQQQQNHGGSVRKIIKQSELVDFDWDPAVQAYMHALKRVIQFAQCIRPPDDPAKCA